MAVDTVGKLFTRDERTDRQALEDATGRTYDAHWVRTSAWKAGNFLRHSGVRNGVTVGIEGAGPKAVLSFFGTALLEGRTRFDPPASLAESPDGPYQALVAPVGSLEEYQVPPETDRVGYGGQPEDPSARHLEAGLWSENPSFPPIETEPGAALLTDGERTVSHAEAIRSGRELVDEYGIERGDRIVVRQPLTDPRVVVAGVIAPLLVDAVCVLTELEKDEYVTEAPTETPSTADGERYVVGTSDHEDVTEPHRIDLADVPL